MYKNTNSTLLIMSLLDPVVEDLYHLVKSHSIYKVKEILVNILVIAGYF